MLNNTGVKEEQTAIRNLPTGLRGAFKATDFETQPERFNGVYIPIDQSTGEHRTCVQVLTGLTVRFNNTEEVTQADLDSLSEFFTI